MAELTRALEEVLAMLSDPGRTAPPPPLPSTPLSDGYRSGYDVNHKPDGATGRGAHPSWTGRPAQSWFMDSQAVAAASIHDRDVDAWVEPPRSQMTFVQRSLLAAALVLGVFGGLAATSAALSDDDDDIANETPAAAATGTGNGAATGSPPGEMTVESAARRAADATSASPAQPAPAASDRDTALAPALGSAAAPVTSAPAADAPTPAGDGETLASDARTPVATNGSSAKASARITQDAPAVERTQKRQRAVRKWRPQTRRPQAPPPATRTEEDLYETR
jgi:hypothetical protein